MEWYLRLKPNGSNATSTETETDPDPDPELYKDNVITFHSNTGIGALHSQSDADFRFNKIFTSCSTQNEVSQCLVEPLLNDLTNGINCSLISYGGPQTGKSYTLLGKEGLHIGLVPKLITKLYHFAMDQEDLQGKEDFTMNFQISAINVKDDGAVHDLYAIDQATDSSSTIQKDENDPMAYWIKYPNWNCCATLQDMLSYINQLKDIKLGHILFKLNIVQTYYKRDTVISSSLFVGDLQFPNQDTTTIKNKLESNFISMIEKGNLYRDKSSLNKLLWSSIFENYKTRFIFTCSLLPILQRETLSTLELSRNVSLINKHDIISNKNKIALQYKYENITKEIDMKTQVWNKEIEMIKDTIEILYSRQKNMKERHMEAEALKIENLTLSDEWKNLKLDHDNNNNNNNNDNSNNNNDKGANILNETTEILLDKNNSLFTVKKQIKDMAGTNRELDRKVHNGERIENDYEVSNSQLMDFINSQETALQTILHENMKYKRQLELLKQTYSTNLEQIQLGESNMIKTFAKNPSDHSISSYGTVASSVITDDSYPRSTRTSGLLQNSIISPAASSLTQKSPYKMRSREHSTSGFNLQILKSK